MKKKLVIWLLAAMMAFSATGCSFDKEASAGVEDDRDEKEEDEDEDKDRADKDSDSDGNNEDRDTEDDEEKDEKKPASGVVLGGDFDVDYDGFEYLYCELLMTESEENEETGKMESQKLNVFIPNGDYTSVNRDTAYADEKGVNFRVTLNPYMQYNADDYTLAENLEYYLELEYDPFYATNYKDLVISEVEGTKKNARATVNYCFYDEWNDTYMPIYCTYYLVEVSKDVQVLVEVEVNLNDVTGKTEDLLKELETFYAFDIEWDETVAQQKLDTFLANGVPETVTCSTGFLLFELPKGWEEDYDYGDYSYYAFAPDGDVSSSGCVISFSKEYLGMESFDVAELVENKEAVEELFAEQSGDEVISNLEVVDYGTTCMGNAVKISFTATDGDYEIMSHWYFISNNDYIYSVEATKFVECEIDVFALTESILANGIVKEY